MRRFIAGILCLIFLSCTHNVKLEGLTAKEEYTKAYKYFEDGDFGRSIELLGSFFNHHPGSEWVDDAQFYYAESYYQIRGYEEALQEFQFLATNFPNSEYTENALLRKAQCLENMSPIVQRDQKITKEALAVYEEFTVRYPYSKYIEEAKDGKKRLQEKLYGKSLEIAEIYLKLGKNEAAKIYLQGVIGRSCEWADKAYLLLGDIALNEGKDSLASFYYGKVGGEFGGEAKKRLNKIQ